MCIRDRCTLAARGDEFRHCPVGKKHELLDEPVGLLGNLLIYIHRTSLLIDFHLHFRTVEADGSGGESLLAKLGCKAAGAVDLSAACSGFVYALDAAKCYLKCHPGKKALVIGCEVLSRTVDWHERTVSMLFGDGAGAAVLETVEPEADGEAREGTTLTGADGDGFEFIHVDGGFRTPLVEDVVKETPQSRKTAFMKMQGRAVFNFAVKKLDEIVTTLCDSEGIKPEQLDRVFAPQAHERILEAVARRME